jgi:hypothetical protein
MLQEETEISLFPTGNALTEARNRIFRARRDKEEAKIRQEEEKRMEEEQDIFKISKHFALFIKEGNIYHASQIADNCGEFLDESQGATLTLNLTSVEAQERIKKALDKLNQDLKALKTSGFTIDSRPTNYGATITNPGVIINNSIEDGKYSLSRPAIKLYFNQDKNKVEKIVFLPSKSFQHIANLNPTAPIPFTTRIKR